MDHSGSSYDTTTSFPECNNNDLTFSAKDISHGKKAENKIEQKVYMDERLDYFKPVFH